MFQKTKESMKHGRDKKKPKLQSSKEADDTHYLPIGEPLTTKDAANKEGGERFKPIYEVYFLGIVPDIVMSSSLTRDKEAQLVDRIEESQIEGKLPITSQEDSKVKVTVSIHGIKVLDMKAQEVLQRHPLHTIAQVVQYSDGGSINYIAFKIGNMNKPVFSAYVFQCLSGEQAQMVCQNVRAMFDKIAIKSG